MEKVKVTISIPKEDFEKLETKAVELGFTRAGLIRCVLVDFLHGEPHVTTTKLEKAVSQSNPTNEIGIISDEKPVEGVFNSL